MATQIQLRNGTAASWTSTNPTLNQGELGVETDTGQFKIGDGITAWTSLTYSSSTGPAQTYNIRSFGDGSDGQVTVNSGILNLSRDMYYNSLTINGTGTIFTNGFKIFVQNILDLTAAPTYAINYNGANGGAGSAPLVVPHRVHKLQEHLEYVGMVALGARGRPQREMLEQVVERQRVMAGFQIQGVLEGQV